MSWWWPFGSKKEVEQIEPRTREDAAEFVRAFHEKYQEEHKYYHKSLLYKPKTHWDHVVEQTDFLTPGLKLFTDDEWYMIYGVWFYAFIWTRGYKNYYYSFGNYLREGDEINPDYTDLYFGSSDDSENDYTMHDFRDTDDFVEYSYPRDIQYQSNRYYAKATRHAKKLYYDAHKLPYKWKIDRQAPEKQRMPWLYCIDFSPPVKPQKYMVWFQDYSENYKLMQHARRLKWSYLDFEYLPNNNLFDPINNPDDDKYVTMAKKDRLIQLKCMEKINLNMDKFMRDFSKLKSRIKVIKLVIIWQQKWYKLIGWEKKGYIRILFDEGFEAIVKALESQSTEHLKLILQTYFELYKRDIIHYFAKLDMSVMNYRRFAPLKKLSLGEFDYYNNSFQIWLKLRYGKHIIDEIKYLSVPTVIKNNQSKKKDALDKDPLENIADFLMNKFINTDFVEHKEFDTAIADQEKIFLETVKEKYTEFQLNFEKEIKIKTHLQQDAEKRKYAEALQHLMPKEALEDENKSSTNKSSTNKI